MEIAICDDSTEYGEIAANIINEVAIKNYIPCNIKVYCSSKELIDEIQNKKYDLFFLDIDMPELNGIETGLLIRKFNKDVNIIYLTSFKGYAYESYEVKAKEYLLKPLNAKRLENVLLECVKENIKPVKFLDIKDVNGVMRHIPVDEITHIYRQKEDRKIHIFCIDNKEIKVVQTIDYFEKELAGNKSIVRSCKSCLINIDNVREIQKNIIYFCNDVSEIASRRCLKEISNLFKHKRR